MDLLGKGIDELQAADLVHARLDRNEAQRDLYRVRVGARLRVRATAGAFQGSITMRCCRNGAALG